MYIEGINPALVYPVSLETPLPFRVGQRGMDSAGREYVFATTTAALAAGQLVMLPLGNTGNVTVLTTAAAIYNREVGVVAAATTAVTAGTGFWAQRKGPAPAVLTSAATAISVPLYTTATAGATSATFGSSNLIRGLTLTTATGGAGNGVGLLNWPTVGTVADTDNNT